MNTRNIFVVVMLILVVALFFYLFRTMDTKHENVAAVQPAAVQHINSAEVAGSSAVRPDAAAEVPPAAAESESKLKDLKTQQRATTGKGLSNLYLVKCSACHGRDGRGPIGPSIAGKSAKENMAILMKYKMKQVPNSAMRGLLEKISDQELETLAEEIAAL
ncbi:MAG: hypothetical protein FWF41_09520 [Betaproteobacteria bacterium]|nr:hypothetical protein [Betaproteobacteria bacterium]